MCLQGLNSLWRIWFNTLKVCLSIGDSEIALRIVPALGVKIDLHVKAHVFSSYVMKHIQRCTATIHIHGVQNTETSFNKKHVRNILRDNVNRIYFRFNIVVSRPIFLFVSQHASLLVQIVFQFNETYIYSEITH